MSHKAFLKLAEKSGEYTHIEITFSYWKAKGAFCLHLQTVTVEQDEYGSSVRFMMFQNAKEVVSWQEAARDNKKRVAASWEEITQQIKQKSGRAWDKLVEFANKNNLKVNQE